MFKRSRRSRGICCGAEAHLEGQLGGVSEFVTLEEPAGGVLEHQRRDAVDQI